MKLFFFAFVISLLTACPAAKPEVAANNTVETGKTTETEAPRREDRNDPFRVVPSEFQNIDFKNFVYPFGKLQAGKLDLLEEKGPWGEMYTLDDSFYTDLTGDTKKEALVFVTKTTCAASCTVQRLIYFFDSVKDQPKMLGLIKTGTSTYGCSLKSFRVQDGKVIISQFGQCKKRSDNPSKTGSRKFLISDLTESMYVIRAGKLVRIVSTIVTSPESEIDSDNPDISFR